ncbi:MAG: c-type cytochrome [Campylobacterota bacterium]|nr:c-type cytochrome [Campylobacterota bacterium]
MIRLSITALLAATLFILSGCSEPKQKLSLDGKKLLQEKCASCHNLDMPAKTYPEEVAPPMMAISFHVHDFISVSTPAERIPKSIEFVKDYVINPSLEKSFCDEASLKSYGLMPSQKGKVSDDELQAIAEYMFSYYNQKNFFKISEERAAFKRLPLGEQLARQNKCFGCHKLDRNVVGPSFRAIAEKYKERSSEPMRTAIKNGGKGQWKEMRGAMMPPFGKLTDDELKTLTEWIMQIGTEPSAVTK